MPKIVDHEKRRDEIALVACRVVAEHGFDQATIVRIAREAGYTTGMVAHYYDTKQEIVIAALRLILRRIEERLTRSAGEAPMDFALTQEQQMIVKATRDFVREELMPHEQQVEETGALPAELLGELKAKA